MSLESPPHCTEAIRVCFPMNQFSDLIRVCLGAVRALERPFLPFSLAVPRVLGPQTNLSSLVFAPYKPVWPWFWECFVLGEGALGLPVSFLFNPNPGFQM